MSDLLIWIAETVQTGGFWRGVLEVAAGVFSFALLMALSEWLRTTRRLKKCVTSYVKTVEFEWKNQTEEFVLMHRVRAFELLLRRVEALQPRTPGAYHRVEQVRDVLESWHNKGIIVLDGEHLPLPRRGEFPLPMRPEFEAQVTNDVLRGLRAIKWLGLKEPAKQGGSGL